MIETVQCDICHQPMQLADEVKVGDKVTSRRWVCNCEGVLKQKSIHEGDRTK